MVYGACLENKSAERPHRFESCILRKKRCNGLTDSGLSYATTTNGTKSDYFFVLLAFFNNRK